MTEPLVRLLYVGLKGLIGIDYSVPADLYFLTPNISTSFLCTSTRPRSVHL